MLARPPAARDTASASAPGGNRKKGVLLDVLWLGIVLASSAGLAKWLMDYMDPMGIKAARKKATARKRELYRRLGRWVDTEGQYEDIVAAEMVISPEQIDVALKDVGGLQSVISRLRNGVLLPLSKPELFKGSYLRPARGVLLYGPPGTGKTMLAKALAKESGACFMNVRASTIQSKWFGDTQKLVAAIFSLADKIAPCIIFIDEVDALLGRRKDNEHEAMTSMKTEFMQLWDGLLTNMNAPVTVLAATNRPYELDDAVLRRFSIQVEVPLPDVGQRESIMKLMVARHWSEGERVAEELVLNDPDATGKRPLQRIAEVTEGFSGSDLSALFCEAAQIPVHEYVEACESSEDAIPAEVRDLEFRDFNSAMSGYNPSNIQAEAYRDTTLAAEESRGPLRAPGAPPPSMLDPAVLQQILELMRMFSAANGTQR